jgi:hypothetical protein
MIKMKMEPRQTEVVRPFIYSVWRLDFKEASVYLLNRLTGACNVGEISEKKDGNEYPLSTKAPGIAPFDLNLNSGTSPIKFRPPMSKILLWAENLRRDGRNFDPTTSQKLVKRTQERTKQDPLAMYTIAPLTARHVPVTSRTWIKSDEHRPAVSMSDPPARLGPCSFSPTFDGLFL